MLPWVNSLYTISFRLARVTLATGFPLLMLFLHWIWNEMEVFQIELLCHFPCYSTTFEKE